IAPEALDREQLLRGGTGPGQLLPHEAEGHRPEGSLEGAAVSGRHQERKEALLAEGPGEVPIQLVALAPGLRDRPERPGAGPGHRGPERLFLRGELDHDGRAGRRLRAKVSLPSSTVNSAIGRASEPSSRTLRGPP